MNIAHFTEHLTEEQKAQMRAILLSPTNIKDTPLHPKKRKTPFNKGGAVELVQHKKPIKPLTSVNISGAPFLFYCGCCDAPERGPGRRGRRLKTQAELTPHARRSHPHHVYFGKWPLHIAVQHCVPASAHTDVLDAIDAKMERIGAKMPKAINLQAGASNAHICQTNGSGD